ncbi:acyl CoA binding protein [Colletotrichum tamarilloi]|uniref:Acyl CoA binding protein n=1 Tax=Colletotrichum tamarilloi TaxID=1209934 RepID=A0ABQ9RNL8_9PEZI|nr:acyl CoA binding protein [Colletotrichum tamarilloi]KAK1508517.1 acyl CoA binding protein [Colletotrichum tamarilloi]
MEGDVDGVMERPTSASGMPADELQREKDKWDAWNLQKGLSRTEAKRRYIEALIETMHKYATTPDAKELVSELEFVWNQIKNNSPSSTDSSPKGTGYTGELRQFQPPLTGSEGPLKVLSPMSEDDAAERNSDGRIGYDDDDEGGALVPSSNWSRSVERALEKLSAEVAALREQITTGREWKSKKSRSFPAWLRWFTWVIMKHLAIDMVLLAFILLWMRKRKDRRLEDLVRAGVKLMRDDTDLFTTDSWARCKPQVISRRDLERQRPLLIIPWEEEEDIPQAVPALAMFVPLEESLFDPYDAPRTEIERIKLCQENLEKHTAAVEQNLVFVYEREHKRILQVAKQEEAEKGFIETPVGLMQGEEALIMESVHAPIPPGADYNDRHLSTYKPPETPQVMPPRPSALQWSLYNAGQAVGQLHGYHNHAQELKEAYQEMLNAVLKASFADQGQGDEPARS